MCKEYRFQLQKYRPGIKITCPSCGHRSCFTMYIDTEGVMTFPTYVGRCDRELHCGYHFTPREFFEQNPMIKDNLLKQSATYGSGSKSVARKAIPQPCLQPSYIEASIVNRSMSAYSINPLYRYLCSVLGNKETGNLFSMYKVGTSNKWGGSTVFWQIDIDGNVRTGKVMCYDHSTGHRIKEPYARVSWVHSILSLNDFHLNQCLYGEHLLNENKNAKVMIVESEKTAIIASHFFPSYLWLATGGKNGCLNKKALGVLYGRDVTLMPDLGATASWTAKVDILKGICNSVEVSHFLEDIATNEQREQGLDIADFLLMEDTPHMLLKRMIQRNPALQILVDGLELEPETITAVEESDLKTGEV